MTRDGSQERQSFPLIKKLQAWRYFGAFYFLDINVMEKKKIEGLCKIDAIVFYAMLFLEQNL